LPPFLFLPHRQKLSILLALLANRGFLPALGMFLVRRMASRCGAVSYGFFLVTDFYLPIGLASGATRLRSALRFLFSFLWLR